MFLGGHPKRRKMSEDEVLEELGKMLGDRRDEILAGYREQRPDDTPWDLFVRISSEARRLDANRDRDDKLELAALMTET